LIPAWLHSLSIAFLLLGLACAVVIAADLVRHKQHMWIMNVVWPVTALFGTVWIVWQYFTYGRLAEDERAKAAMDRDEEMPSKKLTPFPVTVANGALHCGSSCTLVPLHSSFDRLAPEAVRSGKGCFQAERCSGRGLGKDNSRRSGLGSDQ